MDMHDVPAKILIAEDSATQAERLRHILEQQGYEVGVAGNGRIALEMAQQFRPAVIISDVVMPEMDGYELSHRIKAHPELRNTPVILVTTMSDPQDVIRGLECGADNFVLKPYDERYLLGRVRYVLANRNALRAEEAGVGVEIFFNGQRHLIKADRLQILNLLLSTYEAAIERNHELSKSREALQKTADEVLAANCFLDSLIENNPSIIFVKDAVDLRYMRINRGVEELLGRCRDEMLGRTDDELFSRENADSYRTKDREVLAHGKILTIPEELVSTRHQGDRILLVKKIPVLDQNGRAQFLLGIAEDVTEQKEREREIQRLNAALAQRAAEAEAANKELESFSYSVSHDLRAPLRHIIGYADILIEDTQGKLDPEPLRYLNVIAKASRDMGELIDDLLEFSRMGRAEMRETSVALEDLVRTAIVNLELDVDGRDIAWQVAPLPRVLGDPSMLKQVFANLLSNAVKYSRTRAAAQIQIGCAGEEDGRLILFVRDNGVGFDMKYAGKLFGVFQRLHRAEEFEGTGVGLANVQRIIVRHGGRVWAESAPDRGATFYCTLRACDTVLSTPMPATTTSAAPLAHVLPYAKLSRT